MNKILLLIGIFSIISNIAKAQDIVETCADGAGQVVIGQLTEHKYCASINKMNWWNAYAWCDAQRKQLVDLNECGCDWSTNCYNKCPEFNDGNNTINRWHWTSTPVVDGTYVGLIITGEGTILNGSTYRRSGQNYALCK